MHLLLYLAKHDEHVAFRLKKIFQYRFKRVNLTQILNLALKYFN